MNRLDNVDDDGSLQVMIDYLQEEIERVSSLEDLSNVLQLIAYMMSQAAPINAVQGLHHIRAEVTPVMRGGQPGEQLGGTVTLTLPQSLVSTFHDLSVRMNQLEAEDPETFANATVALQWLASNAQTVN